MKRIVFDIETEPFSEAFQKAESRAERRKHAPRFRLACAYIQETRKYRYFVPETATELISLLQRANEVISFNGKNFDILVLQRHHKLKGSTPEKGRHIDLHKILSDEAGFRVSLNHAALINLREKKHTDGRKMNTLTLKELKIACRSDVRQTYRLWKLYEAGNLKVPYKKFSPESSFNPQEMGPGDHMPDKCSNCGAVQSLEFLPWDTEGMTDGQLADYEVGFYGSAFCHSCKKEIDFGF
ncbi:MAG: ribonuclease H-like domain-containing protein [Burkholderiales bacterium]